MTAIATERTLGAEIAADVRALADLIEACPALAEQIAHVLNHVSVPFLGPGQSQAIRAVGGAAASAGAQYIPLNRSTRPAADVLIGRHVRLGLWARSDLRSVEL